MQQNQLERNGTVAYLFAMRRLWLPGRLLLAIISLAAFTALAQNPSEKFERGKVIEKLATTANSTQSYAVYLPSTYEVKNKYPAIYAFDASGRGARAAGIYQHAAEKYGYVVFASNNSRNGQDASTLTANLNAIWNDTRERFSIDPKRVLATGNSGGGRVATVFAYSCGGCVFGVIGAGAGFYQGVPADKKLPFLFLSTAGNDDFNYFEVRELEKKLTKAGVVNHLIVFDGGHQWPPPDIVDRALAWFELQQMKFGRRGKDELFLSNLLAQRMQSAEQLLVDKDLVRAGYAFRSISEDFRNLLPTSEAVARIETLERTSDYKQAVKNDEGEIKQQLQIVADVMSVLNHPPTDLTGSEALDRACAKIAKLHDRSGGTVNSSERRVARRVLNDLFVRTFETALYSHERARNYDSALRFLEIAAAASPGFASIPYNQARISALSGDKKKALVFLQKAVDLGFRDRRGIGLEKAFDEIRNEEQFVKTISTLQQ